MALGADALRERKQFLHAPVAVVVVEVAEVGECAAVRLVHEFHHPRQPLPIAGEPAVVFHDDSHVHLGGIVGQSRQPIGRKFLLFLRRALAPRVHSDRVTAEPLGGLDPREMILDRLGAGGGIGIAEVAEAIAHDQDVRHTLVLRPLGEVCQVGRILCLVLEELVDVFDRVDPELLLGGVGKIEVVEFAGEDGAVQRPFRQRDAEEGRRDRWLRSPGL